MSNRIEEKKILRLVYAISIVAFSIIALYSKDNTAILMGVFSVALIWYAYFIIRKYYPDGDKYILVLSALLSVIGMFMLYRIKPFYGIRQLSWFTIGIAIFILIVVVFPDIESIANFKYFYLTVELGLLFMTQIFGIDIRGSKNWINLGPIGFQPSEFSKFFLILYLASALKDFEDRKQLIIPALVTLTSIGLLVLQKDLGTAIIFFWYSNNNGLYRNIKY